MKIEWLYEAQAEYRDLLVFHKTMVGEESARRFSKRIMDAVGRLSEFPEMGVLRTDRILGQYGFRALFIGKYVCIYRIDGETIYMYHLTDVRTNYIYHIFGINTSE